MRHHSTKRESARSTARVVEDIRLRGFHARGRHFTPKQISRIIGIVTRYSAEGRTRISQRVCRALRWRQLNGSLKDMACREVLRKLDSLGVISLPPPISGGAIWHYQQASEPIDIDQTPITSIQPDALRFKRIESKFDESASVWNGLVQTYHYLHSSRIVGRQIKYIVYAGERPIACFGWADCAWAQRSRDAWIGWTKQQRERNRHGVVNNCRFLIVPWVTVPNLASHLIARCTNAMIRDWETLYLTKPVLLETFVDSDRFLGTCYRAANWQEIGTTLGYAKAGSSHHNSQSPKLMLVYPIRRDFRQLLRGRRL